MGMITFKNVGIRAIAACVPSKVSSNMELAGLIPEEELEKTIHSIGIKEKRFVTDEVCSSDLCFQAARKLLEDNNIDPVEIDGIIFISQTPDYRQPATAPSLQHRLDLRKNTFAFDVNLACSGYVYGLSIAYSFVSQMNVNKLLLLVGETMSKTISQKDKVTAPLFGDAGTATLVEKNDVFGESYFSLNTDGEGADILRVPYGGYRNTSCNDGLQEKEDKEGNIRTGEQLCMVGMSVFNFGVRVVPVDIKQLLEYCGKTIEDIDVLVYHQANKFMTDFFSKRLKLSQEKTPYSLEKFGNTSSASIPLTIVSEMYDSVHFADRNTVLITGFGAGLSWASAIFSLKESKISSLIEYR